MRLIKSELAQDSREARELWRSIESIGHKLGLDRLGVANPAEKPDAARFDSWLQSGAAAGMSYLERHRDIRLNPELFFPGVASIISVAVNYSLTEGPLNSPADTSTPEAAITRDISAPLPEAAIRPRISRYALSRDYHRTIKDRLHILLGHIKELMPGVRGRVAVDTAPVQERHWAEVAGVGWLGRNGCLIAPGFGSWVFLGELFLDIPLPFGNRLPRRCGKCFACLDACASRALTDNDGLDARKCLSYWTIEHKGEFGPQVPRTSPWLFGCDSCQDVCPWNRFARATADPDFQSIFFDWREHPQILTDWLALQPEDFDAFLKVTAMERTRWEGLNRNARRLETESD